MTVEGNLEADNANFAVLRIRLALVDPGIRHMGFHFALEVVVDRLAQWHVFVIAQAGVRLRLALDGADIRLGVTLAEGIQNGLQLGRAGRYVVGAEGLFQQFAGG